MAPLSIIETSILTAEYMTIFDAGRAVPPTDTFIILAMISPRRGPEKRDRMMSDP